MNGDNSYETEFFPIPENRLAIPPSQLKCVSYTWDAGCGSHMKHDMSPLGSNKGSDGNYSVGTLPAIDTGRRCVQLL